MTMRDGQRNALDVNMLLAWAARTDRFTSCLPHARPEQIGKVPRAHAVQSAVVVDEFLLERLAVSAGHVDVCGGGWRTAGLETGAPDEHVQVVDLAVEFDAFWFDAAETLAFGVDEGHVGEVEGLEVVVVELVAKVC